MKTVLPFLPMRAQRGRSEPPVNVSMKDLPLNWSPEVIETAQWLSQLQLTEPPPSQGAEGNVQGPKDQYASQYAIIDTNQMLDHLDAVNSLLEHVAA